MDSAKALALKVDEYTPDRILDAAWLAIGEYKLKLRTLVYTEKGKVTLRKLYPALRQANAQIDRIWNELAKRQANPAYYRLRAAGHNPPQPEWNSDWSFLRGAIPQVFPPKRFFRTPRWRLIELSRIVIRVK